MSSELTSQRTSRRQERREVFDTTRVRALVVGMLLLVSTVSVTLFRMPTARADESPPSAGVAATLASATPPDLATRVADLEAYVTNGAPKALTSPGPGLALFYGGLVRRKNVLSVMAQCLGCAGFVTILWWAFGYSITFASGSPFLGGLKYAFLNGVGAMPNADYGAWVSHSVFAMYQLMFAIITPALIVGAIAERMKYSAIMAFLLGWMLIVYFPLAHMVWGIDGLMNGVWNARASIKAIDFAGGTVVHMSSGWSALVLCIMLGKREGYGKQVFLPQPGADDGRNRDAL